MSSAPALHPIEEAILKALTTTTTIANKNNENNREQVQIDLLAANTGLSIDQVRRGVEWLKFKNLISISESSSAAKVYLAAEGAQAKINGLPERRLINAIKEGKSTIGEILASGTIRNEEVNAAIAGARRNQWIQIIGGKMIATNLSQEKSQEENFLEKLDSNGKDIGNLTDQEEKVLEQLKKRPNYVDIREQREYRVSLTDTGRALLPTLEKDNPLQERKLTTELIISGKWKEVQFSPLDVEAPAPAVFPGRRHPLVDIIEEIKEIFVGLGFAEIDGPIVQSGFWNFDALFTPQDHPAREMQDTFYVFGQKQAISATKDQLKKITDVHKQGWSKGWDPEEAKRVVLRTHTTPVTLRRLATVKPEVARFFSVGRVFRNEKVSYKHLVEFHQVEGVSTAPGASLRDLMGLQKEFYAKMGIKKIKFWPSYFPYTEPSLQSMVYNEKLEKWVELFGMGIFRPEVTQPLGIKNPVLAWGGGLERIAMLRFGLDDVRDLYRTGLAWLRSVPKCQL